LRSTETSVSDGEIKYERRIARPPTPIDESADALRRRADALLDEMMLNGVDVGVNIAVGEGASNGFVTVHPAHDAVHDAVHDGGYANGFAKNGGFAENGRLHQTADDEAAPPYVPLHNATAPATIDPTSTYQPADRLAAQNLPPMPQGATAAPLASPWPTTPDALFSPFDATSLDAPLRPDARLVPAENRYPRPAAPETPLVANSHTQVGSAVRRQSASLASTMTVGTRTNPRSTLLPRALEIDVDTAAQEIMALSSEISATLPVGHEAAERSRHLLNKAQNILQSDPSRTAEVDYYLQQVRRIVQRTRQTHTYSAIYRRRLLLYLTAWVALAGVALAARYLLEEELFAFLEDIFWAGRDALWVQFGPMVIGAFFAGALGGALSVLLNMRRHAAQEYGYFDRKYGLRGLTLPLLGALYGVLLALVWAAVSYFLALDTTNVWLDALPTLIAFWVGFGQEWLYGAR